MTARLNVHSSRPPLHDREAWTAACPIRHDLVHASRSRLHWPRGVDQFLRYTASTCRYEAGVPATFALRSRVGLEALADQRLASGPLRTARLLCESSREAMRRKILALGTAALLAVAACSGSSRNASPTGSRAPSTIATTDQGRPNPDDIPPTVTVSYVNEVLAVLNHVYGDATRSLRSSHSVSTAVKTDLRSIFNDPLYDQQVHAATLSLHGVIDNVRPDPGDLKTSVLRLITASATCIFVQTKTDFSSAFIHPTPQPASEYFELAPKQSGADPQHLNPTPWAFAVNLAYRSPTSAASTCPSA
jgi:hypothetical protein